MAASQVKALQELLPEWPCRRSKWSSLAAFEYDDAVAACDIFWRSPSQQRFRRQRLALRVEHEDVESPGGVGEVRAPVGREVRDVVQPPMRQQLEPGVVGQLPGERRLAPQQPIAEMLVGEDQRARV